MKESQLLDFSLPSPLEKVNNPEAYPNVELWLKRDDLIHPIVSGNKARKLSSLSARISVSNTSFIVTMAGNRSNFLHALSYFCYRQGIPLKAIIRGPEPKTYDATLTDVLNWGTQCLFVSREDYRKLRIDPKLRYHILGSQNGYWLPEGGSDNEAVTSIASAVKELTIKPDVIMVPVGTGATALGIALGVEAMGWSTKVVGVVVLKGAKQLMSSIEELARKAGKILPKNLVLEHGYCGRGFGKINQELLFRKSSYEERLNVSLDPVYTTKVMDAFEHYYKIKNFAPGTQVLIWHTGGLQGNRS